MKNLSITQYFYPENFHINALPMNLIEFGLLLGRQPAKASLGFTTENPGTLKKIVQTMYRFIKKDRT